MYTTKQAAVLFSVSHETIRNWSKEFEDYLDSQATPGRGRNRAFTDNDLEVFALIAEMKNAGFIYQDIHASLKQGQRGTPPEIEPSDIQRLLTTETEKRLVRQIETMQKELDALRAERDLAIAKAQRTDELAQEVASLKARLELIEELLTEEKEKNANVHDLYRQIGQLQGELTFLRRQIDQDESGGE